MDCVMQKVFTMSRQSFSEMDTMHWELIPPTTGARPCSRGEITGMPCSPVGIGGRAWNIGYRIKDMGCGIIWDMRLGGEWYLGHRVGWSVGFGMWGGAWSGGWGEAWC